MSTAQAQSDPTQPPHLSFKLKGWHRLVVAIVGVLLLGIAAFVTFQPIQVLPRMRLAPGFSLSDQDGSRLTSDDLRGRFVLYNFTYTRCQAPACPQNDLVLREVQQRLAEANTAGVPVSFVTISFDPDHDTPAALRAYAASLGADTSNWRFITGDIKRLKNIIGAGFEVFYEAQPSGDFRFSPATVLVDGWGITRAVYNERTAPPEADRILRHLSILGREAANSKGIAKLGYEAAHLFLCYAS